MKLYDRIKEKYISLTSNSIIESGRYVLKNELQLNHHTVLLPNDTLFSDGNKQCLINDYDYKFVKYSPESQAFRDLFKIAIKTIIDLSKVNKDGLISPLLPSQLIEDESKLNELEKLLKTTLTSGHLHIISQQPRIDLKYEEAVTAVGRARRQSNKTLQHLSSHSECWQRRTLTNVIPKKVLARFSEDNYGLYENQLYARLLDRLERYLIYRINLIQTVKNELDKALELEDGDSLDFRLRHEICALWGETYDGDKILTQLDLAEQTLKNLELDLKSIKGLKQGVLYTNIPKNEQVGEQVHRTNILTHDPHYRHIIPLWDFLLKEKQANSKKPEEIFKHEQHAQQNYVEYVGLVLAHALEKYGFKAHLSSFQWAGQTLSLCLNKDKWLLSIDGKPLHTFICWLFFNVLPQDVLKPLERTSICWPNSSNDISLDKLESEGNNLSISPFDLYVVERMGKFIDTILIKQLLGFYIEPIKKVPKPVLLEIKDISSLKIMNTNEIMVIEPCSTETSKQIKYIFKNHTNPETFSRIDKALNTLQALQICPVCDEQADFFHQSNGFRIECQNNTCHTKQFFRLTNDKKEYEQTYKENTNFQQAGRRNLKFVLSF